MSKAHGFIIAAIVASLVAIVLFSWWTGQPPAAGDGQRTPLLVRSRLGEREVTASVARPELERRLVQTLSGATLRGYMGRRQKREIEAVSADSPYRLGAVTKAYDQGHWKLEYFIPGTETPFDMPPVLVQWAGDVAVLTLTDLRIGGKKGTFRARILIDGDEYSGTWSDGKSRGCLFGVILREDEPRDREA